MPDALLTPFHDWLVQLRRHFHQFPELAYQEEKTAAKIAEILRELGVPFHDGVGKTGIVATLAAARSGPTVAFRADMDALPLQEANDVPYRSRNPGVMHACGHDGHVTIALGILRRLVEEQWARRGGGKILFFFQPAEESGGGARAMIEAGGLASERIEAFFAGHMHPELPVGQIGIAPEVSNAASDTLHIRVTGKGGHGAHPHLCVDPVVAAAHLVVQLQSIVSRNLAATESAVITVGKFHAGTAPNIIPQEAVLDGTLRTLRPEIRDLVLRRIEEMLQGLESAFGVITALRVGSGYPVLVNDAERVRFTFEKASELLGPDRVHREAPRMGAEDFAFFLQKCPGLLIRLGCHAPEQGYTYGLHSPHFDFDERALDVGVSLFFHLLTAFLEQDRG